MLSDAAEKQTIPEAKITPFSLPEIISALLYSPIVLPSNPKAKTTKKPNGKMKHIKYLFLGDDFVSMANIGLKMCRQAHGLILSVVNEKSTYHLTECYYVYVGRQPKPFIIIRIPELCLECVPPFMSP